MVSHLASGVHPRRRWRVGNQERAIRRYDVSAGLVCETCLAAASPVLYSGLHFAALEVFDACMCFFDVVDDGDAVASCQVDFRISGLI